MLIESGANVHLCSKDGWTVLHYAASSNNYEEVNVLIEAGAHLDTKNNRGSTPFVEACLWNCSKAAFVLASFGCDLSLRYKYGTATVPQEAKQLAREALQELETAREALNQLHFPVVTTEDLLEFVYHEPNLHALAQM